MTEYVEPHEHDGSQAVPDPFTHNSDSTVGCNWVVSLLSLAGVVTTFVSTLATVIITGPKAP
jgi:hypothetical protein